MGYAKGTGAGSSSTVGTGFSGGTSSPSGHTSGSGPLAAAMRETEARPRRFAPGAVPKIPHGGSVPRALSVPFRPLAPTRNPFGKRLPLPPLSGAALGGLSATGRKLLGGLLRGPIPAAAGYALQFVPLGGSNPSRFHDLSGWTLKCRTTGGANQWRSGLNPNLNCPIPFQVTRDPAQFDIRAGDTWIGYGVVSVLGAVRMDIIEQWIRPPGGLAVPYTGAPQIPSPGRAPMNVIPEAAIPWSRLDPLARLPLVSYGPDNPVPYALIPHLKPNPARSPSEQPSGSQPSSPRPIPRERDDPRTLPAWETVVTPAGPPPPGKPGKHVLRPPRAREKEKKIIMGVDSGSMLGKLINLITESLDALNVAWESLPLSVRKQLYKPNPWEKFVHILMNLDKIQPGTFVAGFLSNQLEDKAFGKLGKIAGQAARKAYNDGFGNLQFQRGPADEGGPPVKGLGRDPYIDWLDQHMWGWV